MSRLYVPIEKSRQTSMIYKDKQYYTNSTTVLPSCEQDHPLINARINSVSYQSVVHMTMYLVLHLFETGKQDGDILLVNSDIEHPMSS